MPDKEEKMEKKQVIIEKVSADNELYEKYYNKNEPQPVYASLDLRSGVLQCIVNYNDNAVPTDVFNGVVRCFGPLPPLKSKPANDLLNRIAPKAQELLDEIDDIWMHKGTLRVDYKDEEVAYQLEQDIEGICEGNYIYGEDIYRELSLDEYFEPCILSDLDLSIDSSEEDIKKEAINQYENSDYPLEGDVDDLFEYLLAWVESERE